MALIVRALLWTLASLLLAGAAHAADRLGHFPSDAPPSGSPPSPLSALILTSEERAFIAQLPVVRLAVPAPPQRPYEQINERDQVSGIHPEMLLALSQAFGIRIQPVIVPGWAAALQAARDRQVDLLMTVGVTRERMEFLEFTLGATPSPTALFGRRDAAPVDPATARYALPKAYLALDWVRRQYPKATIIEVDTPWQALRAAADGRADHYLGNLLEATDALTRQPIEGVEALRLVSYATGHYHFAVRKDWAPLAAILNKGIQTLRKKPSGSLASALTGLPSEMRPEPLTVLTDAQAQVLARRPVWLLGAVQGLPMLNDVDERGVHTGIGAEYAEQVARRLGVALQVVAFENVGAMLDALGRGSIDLVPFLTQTAARTKRFAFSAPYIEMPYLLVARSDAPLYWGLESLNGKRLALAREHPLREIIAERFPAIQLVEVANGNEAMDRVASREADAAVEIKLFANLRINGDNDGQLRAVAAINELPAQFHMAASREAAELVPLIDRALAEIPSNERERMLRRWVARDLAPGFPWKRWLPTITVAGLALLLLLGLSTAWVLRLRAEVQARRRADQIRDDIASTVPGVTFRYVLAPDGRLRQLYVSPNADHFLGMELPTDRTVLHSISPHLEPAARDELLALERHCGRTGEPFKATAFFSLPGAPGRWLHTEAVRTLGAQGEQVWTGYVVDVSSERALQARLAREAEARHLLLATASHELRAPTHNLSLALQAIDPQGLADDQGRAVRIARRSAQTLTHLLNDVLDAARFDSGPLQLRPFAFSLRELLDELAEAWGQAAADKSLAFTLTVAPGVPETLVQDPLRLKQVLVNLLSNACKYTQQGGFELAVSVDGAGLRFVVSDSGPGIAADAQAQLFQPFSTLAASDAPAPAAGSSGLGLMVSRQIAELMGGHVTLDSAPGQGSRFTFVLPLPAAGASGAKAPTSGQTVLVCDDDGTSRMLTAQMLRLRGYQAIEATDGASALATWRRGGVQALITDLDMPGMQGHELIRTLRDEEGTAHTRIIVCSGSPVPARQQPVLHDAYLLKPLNIETLVGALQDLGLSA